MVGRRLALPRARVYETLRSAHLERAHELAPASIVYRRRRYDFDGALAAGLDLVQAGPLGTAGVLARSRVRELEVNEPLMVVSARRTALALAAVRLAGLLHRRRTLVATYAIANDDPARAPVRPGLRAALRRRLDRLAVRFVARRVDRVVFGTDAARDLYAEVLPGLTRHAQHTLVPALPAPCGCGAPTAEPSGSVLFVGAFEVRKGLPLLLAAWPVVAGRRPGAKLTLVGKGPLLPAAEAFAAARDDVALVVDPPREQVHELQRWHDVAVLLSRRTPTWREQVGLPVVEGLAHGCAVLTTTETGLAGWLAAHGHAVLAEDASAEDVADALVGLLDAARPAASVLADLPDVDGRLAADRWMFAQGSGAHTA